MAAYYQSQLLGEADIARAFPLVNAVFPSVDLDGWQRFASHFLEAPQAGGFIGLRSQSGYLCGLLACHAVPSVLRGAVLLVELFLVLDLVNERAAIEALHRTAIAAAQAKACAGLRICLDGRQVKLANCLMSLGLASEGLMLSQAVPALSSAH